jgi:tetrahydromethanopterin S-methyltransferase subunit G
MEAMRQSWTDDRLDDLNGKVDVLWVEMRTEFRAVRAEMKEEFTAVRAEMKEEFTAVRTEMREEFTAVRTEMKSEFRAMNERFDKVDDRLYAMQRLMVQAYGGLFATLIAAAAGLIATQL